MSSRYVLKCSSNELGFSDSEVKAYEWMNLTGWLSIKSYHAVIATFLNWDAVRFENCVEGFGIICSRPRRTNFVHQSTVHPVNILIFFKLVCEMVYREKFVKPKFVHLKMTILVQRPNSPIRWTIWVKIFVRRPHGRMDGWTVRRRPSSSVEACLISRIYEFKSASSTVELQRASRPLIP